jgi:hypothetical protein
VLAPQASKETTLVASVVTGPQRVVSCTLDGTIRRDD